MIVERFGTQKTPAPSEERRAHRGRGRIAWVVESNAASPLNLSRFASESVGENGGDYRRGAAQGVTSLFDLVCLSA